MPRKNIFNGFVELRKKFYRNAGLELNPKIQNIGRDRRGSDNCVWFGVYAKQIQLKALGNYNTKQKS